MGPHALKAISMLLRLLQLLLALFIVGVASFHVYQFSSKHLLLTDDSPGKIPRAFYAVEVISCVAAIYTFLTLIITCLGHKKFFIFAVVFDLLFTGGFIAISVLMRGSAGQNCSGINYSGNISKSTNNIPGSLYSTSTINSSNIQASSSPGLLCDLDKAPFSLAVALSIFFAMTLLLSYLSLREYQKHRAFGPGPKNNYSTSNKPPHKASEDAAYITNNNIAGRFDAPGFRGSAADRTSGYRAPTPGLRDSVLEAGESGRFDPALPDTRVDQRYGGRDF